MHNPPQLPQISALVLEEQNDLTLTDLSQSCAVNATWIVELVDAGVISPWGREPHCWRFSGRHLYLAGVALRLQRDLGINLAGIALVLQLYEEIDSLNAAMKRR